MKNIAIVGLGPGSPALLTSEASRALVGAADIILRTGRHPVVPALQRMGLSFSTCDDLYDTLSTFEEVYEAVADRVIERALLSREQQPAPQAPVRGVSRDVAAGPGDGLAPVVVYAVPGHPLVAEESVRLILSRAAEQGVEASIVTGVSFLDSLFTTLKLDPSRGLEVLDALEIGRRLPSGDLPAVIVQVYDRQVASDVKLALMDVFPEDHPATIVRAAGVPGEERVETLPLHEVDRCDWVDCLTTLYAPPVRARQSRRFSLDPLVDVVAELRSDHGCPWDREQTHTSLRPYVIEEAFEVAEAIDHRDPNHLCEELGDLLLQIVLHAQIAREDGLFDINAVIQGVTDKMIRRHPHVFSNALAQSSRDVLRNWEAIKRAEKGDKPPESALEGVPTGLPALMRAHKIQKRAARVGFDWKAAGDVVAKVHEEVRELEEAYKTGKPGKMKEELGDLLFALVNLARFLGVEPEGALAATTAKFIRRFRYIEEQAARVGRDLKSMTLEEMDRLWDEAKSLE